MPKPRKKYHRIKKKSHEKWNSFRKETRIQSDIKIDYSMVKDMAEMREGVSGEMGVKLAQELLKHKDTLQSTFDYAGSTVPGMLPGMQIGVKMKIRGKKGGRKFTQDKTFFSMANDPGLWEDYEELVFDELGHITSSVVKLYGVSEMEISISELYISGFRYEGR